MGMFKFDSCDIEGLYIVEAVAKYEEGVRTIETYNRQEFFEKGLKMEFVQENQSLSAQNVLRGMGFQSKYSQGKLVRVLSGEIYDAVIDLRKDSKTFGKWFGIVLSNTNNKQLYIPEGFAHGFLVLSSMAEVSFKVTQYYHPEYDNGIIWNDEYIGIAWPIIPNQEIIISNRDKNFGTFIEFESSNIFNMR